MVDASTLGVHKQFEVPDHFGGIVMDKQTGHLVGNTWGSRRFAEWNLRASSSRPGRTQLLHRLPGLPVRPEPQDACGGVTNLPQILPPAEPPRRTSWRRRDDRPHHPAGHPRRPVPEVVHRRARGHAQPLQDDRGGQPAHLRVAPTTATRATAPRSSPTRRLPPRPGDGQQGAVDCRLAGASEHLASGVILPR